MAADPDLAERMRRADDRYRALRSALGFGDDPCAGVGVAGQADPLVVKCLHARIAAFLGGTGDPVGERVLADLGADAECANDECAALDADSGAEVDARGDARAAPDGPASTAGIG